MTGRYRADELTFEQIARLWGLVLLRGLVPSALALLLVVVPTLSLREVAWAVAIVIFLESVLELTVAWRLRGVMPRGALWLTGGMGLAVVGLVLAAATATLVLLLVVGGTWLGVRGLAALWIALTMQHATLDYLLPLAVSLMNVGFGVLLLFWTELEISSLAAPAVAYALCYGSLHAVAAWRIRSAPANWILSRD